MSTPSRSLVLGVVLISAFMQSAQAAHGTEAHGSSLDWQGVSSDPISEAVAKSRARIVSLLPSASPSACIAPSPRSEFEKTDDYRRRIESWDSDCTAARRAAKDIADRNLQAEPFTLPLVDAKVQYDPDTEHFLLQLTQADGRMYVSVPARTGITLWAERKDAWVCRGPVPVADAPAVKESLRLLLQFQFAQPTPQRVNDNWIVRDVRVLGVQRLAGAENHVVFDVPLAACAFDRPSAFAGTALSMWAPKPMDVTAICRGIKITPPRKTRDVRPVYPPIARSAGIQGTVVVEAMVDASGKVTDAKVTRSVYPLLDQAALDALAQSEFAPARCGDVAVPMVITVTQQFTVK